MPLTTAPKRIQGFTLFELLITFIIFGILTALIVPGIGKFRNRYEVKGAFDQVQQVLREAQREAIRAGQACTVTLNLSEQPITITAKNEAAQVCAINHTLPENIKIKTNLRDANPQVIFSYLGSVTLKESQELNAIVYWQNQPDLEKPCLVLTTGIGLIRTGNYREPVNQDLNAKFCEANPPIGSETPSPEPSVISLQPSQPYRIVNRLTGKVLEGRGGFVAQYAWNASTDQKWFFRPADGGFQYIVSQQGENVIEIPGKDNNFANGARLQLGAIQSNADNQQWEIQPVGNGYVVLRNRNTDKVIDIPGSDSNFADGIAVQQWEYQSYAIDQQWSLDPVK